MPALLSHFHSVSLCILATMALTGCGKTAEPTSYHVSGLVTFGGQPIPYGGIQFIPDETKGNIGPGGYATILNGKYSTQITGKGIIGGPYQILITGMKRAPTEEKDPDLATAGMILFEEYRTTAELPKASTTWGQESPRTER